MWNHYIFATGHVKTEKHFYYYSFVLRLTLLGLIYCSTLNRITQCATVVTMSIYQYKYVAESDFSHLLIC